MKLLLANQAYLLGAWAVTALVVGGIVWLLARNTTRREVQRLQQDIHTLVASDSHVGRLPVNGRPGAFVDVAASVNRALDRQEESIAGDGQGHLLSDIFETMPEVAFIHKNDILIANSAAARHLGVEADALVGKPVSDLLRPAYRAMIRRHIAAWDQGQDEPREPIEVQLVDGDQRGAWVELYSGRTQHEGQAAYITVARDITHRKSLEASLGRSKLQARVTLESIGEGVITTDTAGVIDYMNEAAEQLIDTTRGAALGKELTDLIGLVDEVDRDSLGDPVDQCLTERRRVSLGRRALLLSKFSEREFSVELTASPIRGPDGEIGGCVVIFHDVTEIRGLTREMSYQASHDALTGLVNRVEFERRLESALDSARRDGAGHVVTFLDLDRFKIVNDTCGHIAGDNLLREIASLLKQRVRDSDTVARVGGDEFAMLLIGCPLDKARQIAEEVVQSVAEHRFSWQDQAFDIGVSIGLVEVGSDSASAESTLNAADSACYVAKKQGRGRHHVYSAKDEVLAREKGDIRRLQVLQKALKEDQFELFVQPIVTLRGRVEKGPAAELFLRLDDESGKSIPPSQIIGAAERYQLMSHIDRWVVQAAVTRIASGHPHLPDQRSCGVNLSGQTLVDDAFLDFVVDVLDHSGVHPSKLCFEVNETAVVNNLEHARRFINVLHGIGCYFTLDNFGSGIGSFTNLRSLSIDYLKIDGRYTRNLNVDPLNQEMISAIIRLARQLDFLVVAEQVEDSEAFEAVRELGVDFIQGFAVERPRPLQGPA